MTCDEFRRAVVDFDPTATPDEIAVALMLHMDECPHCEELVARNKGEEPTLEPSERDATEECARRLCGKYFGKSPG